MGIAIKFSLMDSPQVSRAKIRTHKPTLPTSNISNISISLLDNVIERSINVNNASKHITVNTTIEYNVNSSYTERKVIDMNTEIQSEIDKIMKVQKCMYIGVFSFSIFVMIFSWFIKLDPGISIVLKPMSIALFLMITLDYLLRRIK